MRYREPAGHTLTLVLAIVVGTFVGLGGVTFRYAEGLSYFSTDPKACANCHIMRPQYDGWQKASHHTSASCVDCHLPDTFFAKYAAKASPRRRRGRGRHRSGQMGPQLACSVRRLPPNRPRHEDAIRRSRGQRGPAGGEDRARPVDAAHVPRVRLLDRLSRPARARLHARGSGGHAATDKAAVGLVPALPRVGGASLPRARRGRR